MIKKQTRGKMIWNGMAVMVLAAMVSGCGGNGSQTGGNTAHTNASSPKATWDNAPQITVAIENYYDEAFSKTGDDPADNPYTRYIFDKTGIRVVPMLYPGNEYKQKLAVDLAGGKKIDLMKYWDLQQEWMLNGSILKINDLLSKYKDETPNIMQNIPQDAWAGMTKISDVWGFPIRTSLGHPDINYVYIRKDWLDKLHLEMPRNTDELTAILKAFTEQDPDGNGKKDTFGLSVGKNFGGVNTWMFLWGADIWSDGYVDGKLTSQSETSQAKAAYQKIGEWFKAGYVDQEGLTDENEGIKQIVNNKIGVYFGGGAQLIQDEKDLRNNGFKDAQWAIVPNQIASSMDNKFYGWPRSDNKAGAIMVTSVAKDLDSIMKLMDWMYSKEGTDFQEWGLPGREYTVVDGKRVKDMKYEEDHKSYLSVFSFGGSYNDISTQLVLDRWGNTELAKQVVDATANYNNFTTPFLRVIFNYPNSPAWAKYPDYRKAVDVYGAKFYLGQIDAGKDQDWKGFIQANDKYGMHKLYAEIEEDYKKSQASGS